MLRLSGQLLRLRVVRQASQASGDVRQTHQGICGCFLYGSQMLIYQHSLLLLSHETDVLVLLMFASHVNKIGTRHVVDLPKPAQPQGFLGPLGNLRSGKLQALALTYADSAPVAGWPARPQRPRRPLRFHKRLHPQKKTKTPQIWSIALCCFRRF